jgi:hypothetical protein
MNDLKFHDFPSDNDDDVVFDDPPQIDFDTIEDTMCGDLIDLTQADGCCINDTVSNLLEK